LKDASDSVRIRAAEQFRDYAGTDVHVHGFGWGVSVDLAAAIRDRSTLLDSLDYSSPVQSSVTDVTPGDERMSVTAAYAGARLVRDLREVTDHPDPPDGDATVAQAGVMDF
jgi:hypothetical protein